MNIISSDRQFHIDMFKQFYPLYAEDKYIINVEPFSFLDDPPSTGILIPQVAGEVYFATYNCEDARAYRIYWNGFLAQLNGGAGQSNGLVYFDQLEATNNLKAISMFGLKLTATLK